MRNMAYHLPARTAFTLLLGVSALLSGCMVGPNYKKPKVEVPETYRGAPDATASLDQPLSFGDQKWWDVFQDEELQRLIRAALENNYDVRIAANHILQARAQLGITRADQFPTVSAAAGATTQRNPASGPFPSYRVNTIRLDSALSWELDFWGQYRRATESARAALLSTEWARQAVITSVVSDVASAYFQLRELDLELEISRRTLASRQDSLRLTKVLADQGANSMLDVRQAEELVYTAAQTIPDLERQIEQQENFISALLGNNPAAVPRGRALTEQPLPPVVPPGIPSTLLQRRPDILQAEQNLIALNAQIGVARAAYFPQISLTAVGGFQSSGLLGLLSRSAGLWSLAAGLTEPIFNAGRIRSGVRLAEAREQEALLVYERTIQGAFREVSDALAGYRQNQETRRQHELLTAAAQDAARLSDLQYRNGAASYLTVLDSETRYYDAQVGLAQTQLDELQSLVQLYRALGGGWQ
jgi:multidrug efflux system outer membrane protein